MNERPSLCQVVLGGIVDNWTYAIPSGQLVDTHC